MREIQMSMLHQSYRIFTGIAHVALTFCKTTVILFYKGALQCLIRYEYGCLTITVMREAFRYFGFYGVVGLLCCVWIQSYEAGHLMRLGVVMATVEQEVSR